jgi:anti-anti-sigma factor
MSPSVSGQCYNPVTDSQPPNRKEFVVDLQISIRESGDVAIVDVRGRSTLDEGESGLLRSNLDSLLASGVRKVLLNLTDLTQMDSWSVTIIVRTYFSLRSQGGELKLLHPCGHVFEIFSALHLLKLIPSFEDETQALASFRPLLSYSVTY